MNISHGDLYSVNVNLEKDVQPASNWKSTYKCEMSLRLNLAKIECKLTYQVTSKLMLNSIKTLIINLQVVKNQLTAG